MAWMTAPGKHPVRGYGQVMAHRVRQLLVAAVAVVALAGCVHPRPDWLGTRPLPLRPDGLGQIQPTPPELVDRQLVSIDYLPPPASDKFESSIQMVPPDVVARSTYTRACPVALEDLRYVKVSFFGFDSKFHTGELMIHEAAAPGIVEVFRKLHAARFPIEEMRIPDPALANAAPTGDGNDTVAFACRPVVTTTQTWSQHAFGLAIDINPFHNPYVKRDIVIPELASAYLARSNVRPGMIAPNDVVVKAFKAMGWTWGGTWNSPKDFQHFSWNGK